MCGATCYALHDAVEAATTTHCSDARSSPHFVLRPAINCSDRAICHEPNDGATLSCRQRCRYAVAIVPHAGVVGDAIVSGPTRPCDDGTGMPHCNCSSRRQLPRNRLPFRTLWMHSTRRWASTIAFALESSRTLQLLEHFRSYTSIWPEWYWFMWMRISHCSSALPISGHAHTVGEQSSCACFLCL